MIVPANGNTVFSAEVRLALQLHNSEYDVSTVEPDRFVLAEPRQIADADAVLMVTVNGEPRRTPIRLCGSAVSTREYAYTVR